MKLFECVPNVSEGRDTSIVDACASAIAASGATLADRTSDPIHHRSVFTYFGSAEVVVAAAVALARVTTARIDLRAHAGEHPRMGALDVLPFVPLGAASRADAVAVARSAAARIWEAAGVPSFLYGDAALRDEYSTLPAVRRGGFEALWARALPDVGDLAMHPSAGAIAVGVRAPLIAFNVVLATGDLRVARAIARALRESSGGLRALRALAIALGPDRVQVSLNVTNVDALPLDRLMHLVRALTSASGVAVVGGELIGLLPRSAVRAVAARRLGLAGPEELDGAC